MADVIAMAAGIVLICVVLTGMLWPARTRFRDLPDERIPDGRSGHHARTQALGRATKHHQEQ